MKIPSSPPNYIRLRQCKNINVVCFIQDLIAINWNRFQLIPFVEDAWNFFYSEVTHVIDKHAPMRTIRVKGRHLPWISSHLISLSKQRDKALAKYRLSKDAADWETYRYLRNLCKTKTRNAKSYYYNYYSIKIAFPMIFITVDSFGIN